MCPFRHKTLLLEKAWKQAELGEYWTCLQVCNKCKITDRLHLACPLPHPCAIRAVHIPSLDIGFISYKIQGWAQE